MRPFLLSLLFASMPAYAVDAPAPAPAPVPQPPFVADLIAKATAAPPTNPPTRILRYTYRGKTVYFVPARCCDVPSTLYDDTGKRLCEPDGGFIGHGDGRCTDFSEQRSDEALVWADTRTSSP